MYDICPKCQHQRLANDQSDPDSCPACGIIFSKWLKSQLGATSLSNTNSYTRTNNNSNLSTGLSSWIFPEEEANPVVFWSRVIFFIALSAWGWTYIRLDFINDPFGMGNSFMHRINLVFHEAGHVVFRPFGWFMTILGGSLFQVIMPLIVMFTFLIKSRNAFGASVGLWWTGQSLLDLTPYIDDALVQQLVLLGGHTGADSPGNHDWGNILMEFNALEKHRDYANLAHNSGVLLMIMAFAWGAMILYRQYKKLS